MASCAGKQVCPGGFCVAARSMGPKKGKEEDEKKPKKLVAKLQAGPKAKPDEKPQKKSKEEWEAEQEAQKEAEKKKADKGQQGGGSGGPKGVDGPIVAQQKQKDAEAAKAARLSAKQAKKDAEAARIAERNAMFPPSDSGSGSEDDALEVGERIATANVRAARKEKSDTHDDGDQEKLKVSTLLAHV